MTNQINPTGRFNVGQEIYVVATVINGRNTINPTLGTVHGDQPTFHFKKLTVTEHHKVSDQWAYRESRVYDGYILTDGEDIYFRVAFKPVATVLQPIETVDKEGNPITFKATGRHDPCVVPRAVAIVEAMAAMVIMDYFLLAKAK